VEEKEWGRENVAYEQFAYTYDRLMADMPYRDWVAWTVSSCRDYGVTPRTAADLGCGTGSIAVPLAQSGLRVFGIDISENMLAIAADKAERTTFTQGGSVVWLCGDLRDWTLLEPVDLAFSYCDSLNYLLEEDDIATAFRQAFEGLAPGGLFLFDMHAPRLLFTYAAQQPFVLDEPDVSYIWTCELDEEHVEIEHLLSIFVKQPNGDYRKIEERHVQRAYEPSWVESSLKEAGFTNIRVTADFQKKAPDAASERIFFAARKPV
jgi:SAM-dependent methyltransferase